MVLHTFQIKNSIAILLTILFVGCSSVSTLGVGPRYYLERPMGELFRKEIKLTRSGCEIKDYSFIDIYSYSKKGDTLFLKCEKTKFYRDTVFWKRDKDSYYPVHKEIITQEIIRKSPHLVYLIQTDSTLNLVYDLVRERLSNDERERDSYDQISPIIMEFDQIRK